MKRLSSAVFTLVLLLPSAAISADSGKFPFFPTLINTSTGQPVPSTAYEKPERCRMCHREIYNQWKGSMHSNAFPDPVFQALWRLGELETEGAVRMLCAGCHTPIGTAAEEVTYDPATGRFSASEIAERGVQCDFCHTVEASTWRDTPTADPGNASLIMDPGDVKRGPYRDSNSPGHDTAFSQLMTSAEFCGSCHNVFHPVTNFPIERTYTEWKQSVYAREGIVCQDCHMMPVELAAEAARTLKKPVNPGKASPMGPQRDNVFTHEFVGGNAAVTAIMGAELHAGMAVKRLQSAARVELELPELARAGELVRFKVNVYNVGAGHNLPTSLTEVREMWLDVTVTDEEGEVVYRSGALDGEGEIDHDAAIFHAVAVDEKGEVTHKPWAIVRFESYRTIPPRGHDTSQYAFRMPDRLRKGELTVEAVLRYRSMSQHLAVELLGEGAPEIPVVEMARAVATVPAGK